MLKNWRTAAVRMLRQFNRNAQEEFNLQDERTNDEPQSWPDATHKMLKRWQAELREPHSQRTRDSRG